MGFKTYRFLQMDHDGADTRPIPLRLVGRRIVVRIRKRSFNAVNGDVVPETTLDHLTADRQV